MFAALPDKPDHPALELEILDLWQREGTFERLREQNRGGPRFSFLDGPVTANRMVLGVHTAWGRTLKDVFQRYRALRGHELRYQNGFDCQGLWIEVGVERQLGLNSKREIEDFGLAEFARRCREVVVQSSQALTEGSIRLGQWMDWGKDYFTFSDTNIEYIWRFLAIVHERGWLYLGHRSTEWCPRCGTSISAHELGGAVEHRVIPWEDVTLDDGTGIVHIAPGCGSEDFELSRVHDLPVLAPVDEAGRFYDDYGWLHGLSTVEAAEQIIGYLEEQGRLVEAGLHEHRYPECWRCHTALIFRISDDWFIAVAELRQRLREANQAVEWVPEYMGKRMDDWLVNMGDWNISRRRYYGLPL